MSNKTDHYSGVLLEDINHKLDAILEGEVSLATMSQRLENVDERLIRVETTFNTTFKAVLKDHEQLMQEHERNMQGHEQLLQEHEHTMQDHEQLMQEHEYTMRNHEQMLREHRQLMDNHDRRLGRLEPAV